MKLTTEEEEKAKARQQHKSWRERNPVSEETKAYRRQWMKDHRKELSDAQRERRKLKPDVISDKDKERKRLWYIENKERVSLHKKSKYEKLKLDDPDKFSEIAAQKREYNSINRDRFRVYNKKWEKANPGALIDKAARRRCRVRHTTSKDERKFALDLIRQWKLQEVHQCAYCDREVCCSEIHIDHILPIASGGKHVVENLCVSCASCNRKKSAKIWGLNWFPQNFKFDSSWVL